MNLTAISPGDIVECDVKGRQFLAIVEQKYPQMLEVSPIQRGITYFEVTARQVKIHWRRAKSKT